ncbi:hypothetical protein WJX84_011378 [Apatococcus fuscideae]|uniref:Uncharacterized protein n=1 Tax=Apatococcus fuscideae TaxID=2026836 RepID=A0AAW1SH84_9CHLO
MPCLRGAALPASAARLFGNLEQDHGRAWALFDLGNTGSLDLGGHWIAGCLPNAAEKGLAPNWTSRLAASRDSCRQQRVRSLTRADAGSRRFWLSLDCLLQLPAWLRCMASAEFRSVKAEHFKKRGDEAVKLGNFRDAWNMYTEAAKAEPDKEVMARVLSNRAMAYSKGGRHADALADAEKAVSLAPAWDKPHMRQGTALLGLQRLPEAVGAFVRAWKVSSGMQGRRTARRWCGRLCRS